MIQARIRKIFDLSGFLLDLEFNASRRTTVLFGAVGAGKTLTLDAVAGLFRPDEGRILVDDEIYFDAASGIDLPISERRCGYVLQNDALFPHMSLRQNLIFAALCKGLPRLERHRRVGEMLEHFNLADVAGTRPLELPGSVTQRCSIACALIGQPKLLLLDEPAGRLDTPLRAELYGLLRQVRSEFEVSMLLATQDLDLGFELGEDVLVLHAGRLVQTGTPRQILDQPATAEVARMLGTFNLLPAQIMALDPGKGTSRLRLEQAEISGPYFPGRLRGDRVMLCLRPEELLVRPAAGKPGPNQVPVPLLRVTEKLHTVRLHFAGGITVEVATAEYETQKHHKEWFVEFPPQFLRAL